VLRCELLLAVRVSDSLHLVETVAAVASKLPGPGPLATAVLDCLLAAAGALKEFTPQVVAEPRRWLAGLRVDRQTDRQTVRTAPMDWPMDTATKTST
jgi:hypothetical protein